MISIKHILPLLLVLILLTAALVGCSGTSDSEADSNSETETETETEIRSAESSEGLEYELSEDENSYIVTGIGSCTDTDIVIPSMYEGKPVTGIGGGETFILMGGGADGGGAFSGCENLTSVTIPDSVTSIGKAAFFKCASLTSIMIPASVTSIGYSAFYATPWYTAYCNDESKWTDGLLYIGSALIVCKKDKEGAVTIKEGTTCITDYAFDGCSGLTSIEIPDSVTGIGAGVFSGCSGLTSITIPDSVTSIGYYLFEGCSGLTSITIGNGVTAIYNGAFSDTAYYNDESNWTDGLLYIGSALIECKRDKEGAVTIKGGTTCIADSAFSGCENLTSITIPGGVIGIGYGAFLGCTGLTSITIPDSVTSIGYCLFEGCSGLTSVTIPAGVTSIGYEAFYHCSGLTSITIPASVTVIGDSAFSHCSGLMSITVAEGNSVYHSDGNCLIETASKTLIVGCQNSVIPNDGSVTSIGDHAFRYCKSLTSIAIPDSVTSIGYQAFSYCTALTSITIPDSVTSIGDSAFSGCTGLTSITFTGTMEQWNTISKGDSWDYMTGSYTIHCTDGDISK